MGVSLYVICYLPPFISEKKEPRSGDWGSFVEKEEEILTFVILFTKR